MRRILCFGDSNTYGYSPVDGQRYGDDINWPGVLDRLLGDKFEVINEGKNGRTVAFDDPYKEGCNGMSDIEACIEDHEPLDLVIIMLGTNDLKVYFDASPQIIAENLRKMCKAVQTKTDARIILASPALLGDQIEFSPLHLEFGRTQVDYSFELAPYFEKVAKEIGAEFIDLAMVAMSSDVDCLHLMPEEHAKVAQAMRDKVLWMFREELAREEREEEARRRAEEEARLREEKEREERLRAAEAERVAAEEEARLREEKEREERLRAAEAERMAAEEEARLREEKEREEAERDAEEGARLRLQAILKAAEKEAVKAKVQEAEGLNSDFVQGNGMGEAEQEAAGTAESLGAVGGSASSEKEKMLSGKLYICDAALRTEATEARKITAVYNQTTNVEISKRTELLTRLFKKVGKTPYIEPPFRCDYGSNITVGDEFYANFDCIMLDCANIKIGDHVFFGPKVNIYTACHPIYAPVRNQQLEYAKEVTIGDDVWIGGNVTINPGVHIGNNVVIGSGSVITSDIPDGVVAAGNPCRILRRISEADKKYWEEQMAQIR
ncbi:MAG: hypothetical protein HFG34_09485 [Eubacterium sp.]|nr:hypothetical protein [Eubacterium sp.]